MTDVIIDDCPACGAMNARASGETIDCRDCGVTVGARPVYECVGCGETMEAPPNAAVVFESPIEAYECDICEFAHPEYIGEGT